MPLYSVRSLVAVGNPVDGYEVNDSRAAGEVYIRPWSDEAGPGLEQDDPNVREVIGALADAELLGDEAGPVEVEFHDSLETEMILVNEPEYAPYLELERQILHGGGPIIDRTQFWQHEIHRRGGYDESSPFPRAPYDIRFVLGYDAGRLGVEVLVGASVDPRPLTQRDRFEWDLAEWQRRPTFGFDPLTSEEIRPTKKQLAEILVALDQYLEKR